MVTFIPLVLFYLHAALCTKTLDDGFCSSNNECPKRSILPRYVLYDVNEPEGFNLKRDVYIRMATFMKKLSKEGDWHLVLPPWYNLFHWRSLESETGPQNHVSWEHFFHIASLQSFVPVVEYIDFVHEVNSEPIDFVFVLQHISTNFEQVSEWKDGWSIEPCHKETSINYKKYENIFKIKVLGYNNVTAKEIECVSFHGESNLLAEIVKNYKSRSILIHHAEVALHNNFGDALYWQCRRSMRFAPYLVKISAEFREKYLNSTDSIDKTEMPDDWRLEKPGRKAVGGPYLAVHLRRRDFLWGRPRDTPSIKGAVKQIKNKLVELDLDTVFVATDAPEEEYVELKSYLVGFKVFHYIPTPSEKRKIKDGGVAIVDQIICSHARFFIGSFESTFSFRIQEEREILGFKKKTTFNRFCGDQQKDCVQPTQWTIVY
ncbi:O-fucosyltransferase 2 [Lycorma delicatula]|uniref:O-fucosyltransferase 2 n=1 Tax=Lycorma delicatula TaxID=130591 RepID=UPI003F515808